MNRKNPQIEVNPINAAQTRPLRSTVLRPDRPFHESVYVGDDDPATIHVGALLSGAVVCVASFYREALPPGIDCGETAAMSSAPTWRLRGMAVEPAWRGQGIGAAVLQFGITEIARRGGGLLWCNARSSALGFYRAAAFVTCGDEFVIPDVGPHFVMAFSIRAQ